MWRMLRWATHTRRSCAAHVGCTVRQTSLGCLAVRAADRLLPQQDWTVWHLAARSALAPHYPGRLVFWRRSPRDLGIQRCRICGGIMEHAVCSKLHNIPKPPARFTSTPHVWVG